MKRKRGSWSSEEDEESYEEDEESYDGSERTESDEEQSIDPGYDYTKDESLLHTDEAIFSEVWHSWEPLMDRFMANTDSGVHLTAGALYSLFSCNHLCDVGPFPWLSLREFMAISIGFDNPRHLDVRGLYLRGTRYELIERGPDDIIRGVLGAGGCTIVKSSKVLIIGIFQHPMTSSECDLVVTDMKDHLKSLGY